MTRSLGAILAVAALVALGVQAPAGASTTSGTAPSTSAAAHAAKNASIKVSPRFFGIHDGSGLAYGRIDFGSIRLWDAQVTWQDIEKSPGVYDWTRLDSLVADAQAHGTEVTLVLAMTPSFYSSAPSLPPTDLAAYRAFVTAVMTRYRDFNGSRGILDYQVWNEGNVRTFWTGTPHQLAALTQVVDQVRDQVDPDATVVAPSFAVRLKSQRKWLSQYVSQRIGGRPVWRYYDVNALSLYPMATYGSRTGGPEDAVAMLPDIKHRLARAKVPASMPLWATEINYGLPSGAPPGHLAAAPISQRRQAANVIRTYLLAAAAGVSRVYWYRYDWDDLPASAGGGTLGNTLLSDPTDHQVVAPAGQALATVAQWMRGRLVGSDGRQPCASNAHGTYTCTVRYQGGTRTILWNPFHKVTVHVPDASSKQNQQGRSARVDSRVAKVKVGYRPVMVTTG
ncbi:MAG: hypothetical protein QM747_00260 [Nocardioides sp.]